MSPFKSKLHAVKECETNFDFLKTKVIKSGFPEFSFLKNNIGIEKAKKDEIVKNLCPFLKHNSREYWKNIDYFEN